MFFRIAYCFVFLPFLLVSSLTGNKARTRPHCVGTEPRSLSFTQGRKLPLLLCIVSPSAARLLQHRESRRLLLSPCDSRAHGWPSVLPERPPALGLYDGTLAWFPSCFSSHSFSVCLTCSSSSLQCLNIKVPGVSPRTSFLLGLHAFLKWSPLCPWL